MVGMQVAQAADAAVAKEVVAGAVQEAAAVLTDFAGASIVGCDVDHVVPDMVGGAL